MRVHTIRWLLCIASLLTCGVAEAQQNSSLGEARQPSTPLATQTSEHYSCCPPAVLCHPAIPYVGPISGQPTKAKNHIDSVTFDGPVALSGSELNHVVASLKEKEFERDPTWLEGVEDQLRDLWLDQGYFKAKITAQAVPVGGDDGRYAITAHVDEGRQYRLGLIEFRADPDADSGSDSSSGVTLRRRQPLRGNDSSTTDAERRPVFPAEELRDQIPLNEEDIFNVEKFREGLNALRKLYGQYGYINFVPQPITKIDEEHRTVSVRIDLAEEKQFHIGKIEVRGLDVRTQSSLIWNIESGDVFNYKLLQVFFDDNQSNFPAGSYSAKDPEIIRDSTAGIVDLEFTFTSCRGSSKPLVLR